MRTRLLPALFIVFWPAWALAAGPIHRADQVPGTAEEVARGRALFANCTGCHGARGEGIPGVAPRLDSATWLAIVPDAFIRTTIRSGRPGTYMIAWGKAMPAPDVDALVAYVRSWQATDGIALDESPLVGDAAAGQALFDARCATCHGARGAGYSAQMPGIGIGRSGFLDAASNGLIRALLEHGKTGTGMKDFSGPDADAAGIALTREQIDGVILYLRANAW